MKCFEVGDRVVWKGFHGKLIVVTQRNKCGIEFDACKKEVPMRGTIALALSTDGTDGKWWAWVPMTQIDLE